MSRAGVVTENMKRFELTYGEAPSSFTSSNLIALENKSER